MTAAQTAPKDMATFSQHDVEQIDRANATGLTPAVFIHGLWLLPSSWDRWAAHFEEAGYAALAPGWPDDPATVEEAKAHPEVSPASRSATSRTSSARSSTDWIGSRP